jgi:hypothetical protein
MNVACDRVIEVGFRSTPPVALSDAPRWVGEPAERSPTAAN